MTIAAETHYVKNQMVRLKAKFTDPNSITPPVDAVVGSPTLGQSLVDPTVVTFKVKDPSGAITTFTPVRDSQGLYHYDIIVALRGTWKYRTEGTGTYTSAAEGAFVVDSSDF